MAAAVTVSPNPTQVGKVTTISGTGFLPSVKCTMKILEIGLEVDETSDASGAVGSAAAAARAVATLTSDATIPTAADTVTLGTVTYTFRASVTTTANEVLLGANAAASLANLAHAVNADGTAGVYGSATVANPDIGAGAVTATTVVFYAKVGGTAGNSLTSTEASTHLSFGGATFAGGAAATTVSPFVYQPASDTPFTVQVSDGTSTATATVAVFTE